MSEDEDNSLEEVDTSEDKKEDCVKINTKRKKSDAAEMKEWFHGSLVNENEDNKIYDIIDQVIIIPYINCVYVRLQEKLLVFDGWAVQFWSKG